MATQPEAGLWLFGQKLPLLRSRTELQSPVRAIIMFLSLDQFGVHTLVKSVCYTSLVLAYT